jgi:UDP-N-acetylmuramate dehydrogenase
MKILTNTSLKKYNTFGIDVKAKQFIEVQHEDELSHLLKRFYAEEIFVLGGGSNMLLTKDIDKTVFHINILGKKIVEEHDDYVIVEAKAGENWHEFVEWSIQKGYGGLENLSLIPGNVGTAPVQNIGAYGVELKDVFVECEAIHRQTTNTRRFNLKDCNFGYRQSVFKAALRNQYIITKVSFKLTKRLHHLNYSYGAIKTVLASAGTEDPDPKDISDAVIQIRQSKLPDPHELGNSGSFFKNPVLDSTVFQELKTDFPEMPSYQVSETQIKVPAGWLIEQAGLKGFRVGDAGVHAKQALVLVNYGTATGTQIYNLSLLVQKKVKDKFGIQLEPEVNIF